MLSSSIKITNGQTGGVLKGVQLDQHYVDELRDEERGRERDHDDFSLARDHTQCWVPQETDMMYMAISFFYPLLPCMPSYPLDFPLSSIDLKYILRETSTPTIEAIIVVRKGDREYLLTDNILTPFFFLFFLNNFLFIRFVDPLILLFI